MTKTAVAPRGDALVAVEKLDELAEKYSLAAMEHQDRFSRAITLAEGMSALRGALMPYLPKILPLQNSPLGFLTDKREGYPPEVVCECLIEATLRGLFPVGNEMNIISGRCYITKNGYARLVRELQGLSDLKLMPGVPKTFSGGAVVPYRATWKLDGKPDSIEREIPVRVNAGMGADAILGKAQRKMLAAVYGQVTGSEQTGQDGEVGEDVMVPASGQRTAAVAETLREKANGVPPVLAAARARIAELGRQLELSDQEQQDLLQRHGVESLESLGYEGARGLLDSLELMLAERSQRQPGDGDE